MTFSDFYQCIKINEILQVFRDTIINQIRMPQLTSKLLCQIHRHSGTLLIKTFYSIKKKGFEKRQLLGQKKNFRNC